MSGTILEATGELLESLAQSFDLETPTAAGSLGDAVRERLRALDLEDGPQWGEPGQLSQVAMTHSDALDFYYRPHLFPEMSPELKLAHRLQFDLLPRELPSGSPVTIAAVLESFCHLSGDQIGWREEGDGLFCWVADVSGHGVRAGLASAVLYFLIEGLDRDLGLSEFACQLNERVLAARNAADPRALYATGFFCRISPDGRCRYVSAGHPPMLYRRADGTVERLPAHGLPIGILADVEYPSGELRLQPGEMLFLYTDGLLEARDPAGVELGVERIEKLVSSGPNVPLELSREAYRNAQAHKQTSLLDDDLTFLSAALA